MGLTEELARAQGPKVTVNRLALERVDRAQTSGDTEGFIKIVASSSGRVLGGTIVAPVAAELANELSVAVAGGLDLQRLASTMHVYPTIGLGIQQIASDFAFKRTHTGLRGFVAQALITSFRR